MFRRSFMNIKWSVTSANTVTWQCIYDAREDCGSIPTTCMGDVSNVSETGWNPHWGALVSSPRFLLICYGDRRVTSASWLPRPRPSHCLAISVPSEKIVTSSSSSHDDTKSRSLFMCPCPIKIILHSQLTHPTSYQVPIRKNGSTCPQLIWFLLFSANPSQ
jgi:hypothetical protein